MTNQITLIRFDEPLGIRLGKNERRSSNSLKTNKTMVDFSLRPSPPYRELGIGIFRLVISIAYEAKPTHRSLAVVHIGGSSDTISGSRGEP